MNLLSLIATTALMASPIQGWDGIVTGHVTGIHLTDGGNFGFRVFIEGNTMCTGGPDWAYMNVNWSNYQATSAFLLTAWASGKRVRVHTHNIGGHCQIGYVSAA